MKKMNMKKIVLKISSAYIAYSAVLLLLSALCHSDWCDISEDGLFGLILFSFAPLLLLFLFSLITYKMRDEVFHEWWNFARWWVPIIIFTTLCIENIGIGGRYPMANGSSLSVYYIYHAQFLIYTILYATLVVTSIVKIVRAYGKK